MYILKEIVSVLNKKEITFLNRYYTSLDGKAGLKRGELLKLVKSSKRLTYKKAARLLYKSVPNSALSHLIANTTHDVLNSLLLKDSKSYPASYYEARIKCKELQLLAEKLLLKGAYPTAIQFLSDAIKIAEDFDLKFELIPIYDTIHTWLNFPVGSTVIDNYPANLNLDLLSQIIDAEKCHSNLIISNWYFIDKSKFNIRFFLETYNHLITAFNQTKSDPLKYWCFHIATRYFRMKGNYNKALGYAMELLKMLQNKPTISSVSQIAEAKLLIATVSFYLNDYDLVREQINDIIQNNESGILNQSLAMEILFLINFYEQKYEDAEKVINNFFDNSRLNFSEINTAKWNYFNSNLQFVKGKHDQSKTFLDKAGILKKDKLGWGLGINLLEILNHIEMKDYRFAGHKLHSFRQSFRHKKGAAVERTNCICRILNSLIKNEFDYDKVLKINADDIEKLTKAKNKNYRWDPLGFEIIRFDSLLFDKFTLSSNIL